MGLITAGQKEFIRGSDTRIDVVLNWLEELSARVPLPLNGPDITAGPQSSTADQARACPLDRRDWRAGTGATTGSRNRCRR